MPEEANIVSHVVKFEGRGNFFFKKNIFSSIINYFNVKFVSVTTFFEYDELHTV